MGLAPLHISTTSSDFNSNSEDSFNNPINNTDSECRTAPEVNKWTTIMTDPEIADRTYIEPLTVASAKRTIEKERPDAIL